MPCWSDKVKIVRNEGTIIFGNVGEFKIESVSKTEEGSGAGASGERVSKNNKLVKDNSGKEEEKKCRKKRPCKGADRCREKRPCKCPRRCKCGKCGNKCFPWQFWL